MSKLWNRKAKTDKDNTNNKTKKLKTNGTIDKEDNSKKKTQEKKNKPWKKTPKDVTNKKKSIVNSEQVQKAMKLAAKVVPFVGDKIRLKNKVEDK